MQSMVIMCKIQLVQGKTYLLECNLVTWTEVIFDVLIIKLPVVSLSKTHGGTVQFILSDENSNQIRNKNNESQWSSKAVNVKFIWLFSDNFIIYWLLRTNKGRSGSQVLSSEM